MHAWDAAVREEARRLGFDRVGFADASVALQQDFDRFQAYLREGMHGGMRYLAAHGQARQRLDGPEILAGARSVVCVAQRYAVEDDAGQDVGLVRRIARYARGRDYHTHMRRKLRKLADFVRALSPDTLARPLCDTAPVLERAWAVRAGLGFIGKNGCLIVPGLGSWVLLGEVVTTLRLTPDAARVGRCGACTRCLEACPTEAFSTPFVLDARKCIAYLTIEHRGACEAQLGQRVAPRLFGCDTCQEVCPYNRSRGARIPPGGPFDPLPQWYATSLRDLLSLDEDALAVRMAGSPLRRVRGLDWQRNALLALGENIDPATLETVRALAQNERAAFWLRTLAVSVARRADARGALAWMDDALQKFQE